MCNRLGDVPPAGRDTHVYYYGHGAAVVLPGKIGSRRRRRRRRHRRGRLVCNMCAAHRDETRLWQSLFGHLYYIILLYTCGLYVMPIIPSAQYVVVDSGIVVGSRSRHKSGSGVEIV